MNKPMKVKLHILSPTHIGCGEDYEPTSFVIDDKRNRLIHFELREFANQLSENDRKKFLEITSKGTLTSIIEIYRFIYGQKDKLKGNEVEISKDLVRRYLEVKDMQLNEKKIKQELNNFALPRTAYLPYSNKPYIPGSSLKGAIRTGYLSMLALSGNTKDGIEKIIKNENPTSSITGKRNAKELEIDLLKGQFSSDPFTLLKVSDFLPTENCMTKILYGVNVRKSDKRCSMAVPFETITSGTFEGMINLEEPSQKSEIKDPLNWRNLSLLFHKHYARIFNKEKEAFNMPLLGEFQEKIKKTSFLIRLGRHSGAEAVTIEGNRNIKIMQGRNRTPKYFEHSTTIWLASDEPRPATTNNLLAFGWAILEVVEN